MKGTLVGLFLGVIVLLFVILAVLASINNVNWENNATRVSSDRTLNQYFYQMDDIHTSCITEGTCKILLTVIPNQFQIIGTVHYDNGDIDGMPNVGIKRYMYNIIAPNGVVLEYNKDVGRIGATNDINYITHIKNDAVQPWTKH